MYQPFVNASQQLRPNQSRLELEKLIKNPIASSSSHSLHDQQKNVSSQFMSSMYPIQVKSFKDYILNFVKKLFNKFCR